MRHLCSIAVFLFVASVAIAETRVRIIGMRGTSEGQVLEMLGDRLEYVRSSDASTSRADDAAFLLRQVLRKEGYADVEVAWKIVSRSEILLTVHEGGRLSLGRVRVNGVPSAEAKRLAKLYARPTQKDRSFVSPLPPFREADIETGLSYLRQDLNAQGYWGAEVLLAARDVDAGSGTVNLTIEVRPGTRQRIAVPRIVSPDPMVISEVQALVKPYVGRAATTGQLNAMRLEVEKSFTSHGYPDAKISMSHAQVAGQFVPEFFIDLGPRVRLDHIHITGLVRTKYDRIAQRVKNFEGEWYDEVAISKRVRGILATGAFSSARIERSPIAGDRIDATLHLEEARARQISLAAGVDSYQGFILRTSYADRNLNGQVLGLNTGFEFSARGILGEARLSNPWLFGSDVAAMARYYALVYRREGYRSFETGLEGQTSWKFGDHYTLDLLGGYSLVNLSEDGLPISELGETVYTQPRLRLTQTLDYRDSAVLPTRGWHLESPLEIGSAVGNLSTNYAKASLKGGWYYKLNGDYQLGLGGDLGVLIPSGDGQELPIDLRLFNGGSRSVRSFPERQLGPTVNDYATGGEASWSTNAELIRSLGGTLKSVAFFDAGTLSRSYDQLGSSDVELAIGLGLRLNLPIGPIRLEYGYNLTQDHGEPTGTLHFAIGITF
jgi:outer membrane protein assembly complex protein YaeT